MRGDERVLRYRQRSRGFHGETVAGNSSETVHDQPSRFTVWRLIALINPMRLCQRLRGDPRFEKIVGSLAPK
jgi:hypothetical protein